MTWQAERARKRISELMQSVPEVVTEDYTTGYRPRFLAERQSALANGLPESKALVNIPRNRAIMVDGVHIYATLANFDEYRLQEGSETDTSHARALNFLHLHYAACDRVVERHEAHRVDFHGPRVHIVVVEPSGPENTRARVLKALHLAKDIQLLSGMANQEIAEGKYPATFRIGIDTGVCAAIDGGKAREHEPLFLGSPANHAAKLAEGNEPGIYVSDSIRKWLSLKPVTTFDLEYQTGLDENTVQSAMARISMPQSGQPVSRAQELLNEWREEIRKHHAATGGASNFSFHYHAPPLVTIKYEDLSPGNSIRMPLASIFADVDGYTRFIDQAMASRSVGQAVRALHVIRGELNNVLQSDFKGRKVRFIGDCIHGLVAEGSSTRTDEATSVKTAVQCAGAMRSSFELCQQLLPTTKGLGLAIGIELGPTPISRIGIRGERSVRVANSVATTRSEAMQKGCNGHQTGIGPAAYQAASRDIQHMFGVGRVANDFGFHDATMMSAEPKVTATATPAIHRAHACQT